MATRSLTSRVAPALIARDFPDASPCCAYCRCELVLGLTEKWSTDPWWWPVVDHKVPRSRGGRDHLENLHLTCPPCNSRKGARTHSEYLAVLAAEVAA